MVKVGRQEARDCHLYRRHVYGEDDKAEKREFGMFSEARSISRPWPDIERDAVFLQLHFCASVDFQTVPVILGRD